MLNGHNYDGAVREISDVVVLRKHGLEGARLEPRWDRGKSVNNCVDFDTNLFYGIYTIIYALMRMVPARQVQLNNKTNQVLQTYEN